MFLSVNVGRKERPHGKQLKNAMQMPPMHDPVHPCAGKPPVRESQRTLHAWPSAGRETAQTEVFCGRCATSDWLAARTKEVLSCRNYGFISKLHKSVWTRDIAGQPQETRFFHGIHSIFLLVPETNFFQENPKIHCPSPHYFFNTSVKGKKTSPEIPTSGVTDEHRQDSIHSCGRIPRRKQERPLHVEPSAGRLQRGPHPQPQAPHPPRAQRGLVRELQPAPPSTTTATATIA